MGQRVSSSQKRMHKQVTDLQTQLASEEHQKEEIQRTLSAEKLRIQTLQCQLERATTEKQQLSDTQQQLKTQLKDSQEQTIDLKKQLQVKEKDRVNIEETLRKKEHSFSELKSRLETERENIQKEFNKLQERLKKKDTEKANQEQQQAKMEDLSIKFANLETQLSNEKTEKEKLEKSLTVIQQRLKFSESIESEAIAQRQQVKNLQTQLDDLQTKLGTKEQELIKTAMKCNDLEKQLKEEHERFFKRDSELNEHRRLLEDQLRDERVVNQQEQVQMEQQLQNKDSCIATLTQQLKVHQERNTDLQGQLTILKEQTEGKNREIAHLKRQFTNIQRQSEGKDRNIADLQSRLNNQQEKLRGKKLHEQSASKDREIAYLQSQLTGLKKQIDEKNQEIAYLLSQLTEQSERMERQIAGLLSQLEGKEREISDLRGIERQTSKLQRQVTDLQNQLSALKKQSERRREISTTREKLEQNQNTRKLRDWVINGKEIQINTHEVLKQGAWGRIVRGSFRRCKVAVKELYNSLELPQERALFEREMGIAFRCRHPCLLQFIGATSDENPLIVTEFMDYSLRSLYEERPLSEKEFIVISLDVVQALNYLHQTKPDPIIHRDISSVNVLLWQQGDQWRGKLSNYGTANVVRQCTRDDPETAIYCAPEAISGFQDEVISYKMDVYSFGVLVCEMFIRELPDPQRRDEQVRRVTDVRLRSHLIRPCLRPQPGWRTDVEEIIDGLEKWLKAATTVDRPPSCAYQEICHRFKSSLKLADVFFDKKHDMCYCTDCHAARGDKLYYNRGEPPKNYGIPVGWCRFGLKVQPRAIALNVFDKWHVAFHGTRLGSVSAILKCGDLLIPGDVALGGRELREEEGHFNDDRKPRGFDTKQIFVSPSVRYAGDEYAEPSSFKDPTTKKRFVAKTVLQLCIKPGSYKVGPQTIGAGTTEIDPLFSNEELEWSTKERGAIILYGLLVKLDKGT